jgi:hypothetical protein
MPSTPDEVPLLVPAGSGARVLILGSSFRVLDARVHDSRIVGLSRRDEVPLGTWCGIGWGACGIRYQDTSVGTRCQDTLVGAHGSGHIGQGYSARMWTSEY